MFGRVNWLIPKEPLEQCVKFVKVLRIDTSPLRSPERKLQTLGSSVDKPVVPPPSAAAGSPEATAVPAAETPTTPPSSPERTARAAAPAHLTDRNRPGRETWTKSES